VLHLDPVHFAAESTPHRLTAAEAMDFNLWMQRPDSISSQKPCHDTRGQRSWIWTYIRGRTEGKFLNGAHPCPGGARPDPPGSTEQKWAGLNKSRSSHLNKYQRYLVLKHRAWKQIFTLNQSAERSRYSDFILRPLPPPDKGPWGL
jgi:hypothetical protein